MNDLVKQVLKKHIQEEKGVRYFVGDDRVKADLEATEILAKACPRYKTDEEDEICLENMRTCFNCLYRRWTQTGITCYQGFPVE